MNLRTKKQFDAARPARIAAGDRVFSYLAGLPSQTAIAVATRVEVLLALEWDREQEEMRAVGDNQSFAFEISEKAAAEARNALTETRFRDSNERAEQHVIDLLAAFPLDQRWWTMHRVRGEIVGWFRMKGAAA